MSTGSSPAVAGRRSLTLALALCLTLAPAPALAQDGGFFAGHKRWVFAILGAAVTAIPAVIFSQAHTVENSCSTPTCVTVVAGTIGTAIGFMIGREFDSRYNRRMAAGPSLKYEYTNVPLGLVPDRLTGFPGGAAVSGLGGARIVLKDGTTWNRAFGVRGIEDLAVLTGPDLLVLSTASSLLAFPLRGDSVRGEVIDIRGGGSMGVFRDYLAVAAFDSLRLLQLQVAGDEVSVETLAGLENLDFVTDISFSNFGRIGWVLMEDKLVSYTSDLERIGEVTLPAAGRTVRARGSRLVVAAGTEGVYVLDAADPARPTVVQHYTGVRFAYAADLGPDVMYVAAGPEGVAVVDLRGPEPSVLGVARQVRFASDVVVSEDYEVWILDREGRRVQLAVFDLGMAGDQSSSGDPQ